MHQDIRERGDRKAMMRIRAAHERIVNMICCLFPIGADNISDNVSSKGPRPTCPPEQSAKRPGEELKKIRPLSPFGF